MADDDQTRYQRFVAAYRGEDRRPWDSGIVPPEVRDLVEGETPLPPERALDVGCGTGVSAVYLAQHGWQVTGVDWVAEAVALARQRAENTGLGPEQVCFLQADVTASDFLEDESPVGLWLDVGCLHGLAEDARPIVARHAARLVRPGGWMYLYAWRRHERDGQWMGIDPDETKALFDPAFRVVDLVLSQDEAGAARPAAWYRLRRAGAQG